MSKAQILRKLQAYKSNPNVFKEVSNTELADLVIMVMSAVQTIEQAIETKKLDIDTKFSTETEKALQSLTKDSNALFSEVVKEVNKLISKSDTVLNQTSTELEKRVQTAIANIRNGNDGIVTESEIRKAAEMAALLIDLPDFDELVAEALTTNANATRDGLESIVKEEDKLAIDAIGHLRAELDDLRTKVGKEVNQSLGGGASEKRIRQIITEMGNGSGVTDGDKGDITVSSSGATWTIDNDTIGLDELSATGTPSASTFLRGDNTWASLAGGGDVSKVGTPVDNQVGVWTGDGTLEGDAALTFDTTTNTLATEIVTVTDDAYGAGWNGSFEVPTKNAVYDKIQTISSGITRTVVVTSGSATMGSSTLTDYVYLVAGAHTMSLPAASGNTNRYTVKNNHSAIITVDTAGAETVDGAASISVPPEASVDIISNGTNFNII